MYEFREEDAERFARTIGGRHRRKGSELQFEWCPYCRGNGKDRWTFSISMETGAFNCRRASCGIAGGMIDLAKQFEFSLGSEVDEYINPKRHFKSLRTYPRPTTKDKAVEYFAGRGISEKIVKQYSIGQRKDDDSILVIPFFDTDGVMRFIKYRRTQAKEGQNKEWCEPGCRPILFGMDQCDPARGPLVMTEGQIDSLSVVEAFDGQVNAVSVPLGMNGFTWVPYCWDFLGRFDELIVFGDHEKGRITLLADMVKRFHGIVKHVREEDYKGCKDANEILTKHGADAVRYAVSNAVAMPIPEITQIADVERLGVDDTERISTGLRPLDNIIGGFSPRRLILLTGKRGNGKSTLAIQFGAEALEQGLNVMIYSGEMENKTVKNWLDRQLAGKHNVVEHQDRSSGYKQYFVKDDAADKIEEWYRDRAYLYNSEIVTDGRETSKLIEIAKKAITVYGCRMIILDNLMSAILKDMASEQTDMYLKQALFVHSLVDMAKKFGVIVVLVVHPRKGKPGEFDNDDISGSSNITDQADIILNYATPDSRDTSNADRLLTVTKNRIDGHLNKDGIPLWYEDSSKRISALNGLFDKQYGWETKNTEYVDVDEADIPFD